MRLTVKVKKIAAQVQNKTFTAQVKFYQLLENQKVKFLPKKKFNFGGFRFGKKVQKSVHQRKMDI